LRASGSSHAGILSSSLAKSEGVGAAAGFAGALAKRLGRAISRTLAAASAAGLTVAAGVEAGGGTVLFVSAESNAESCCWRRAFSARNDSVESGADATAAGVRGAGASGASRGAVGDGFTSAARGSVITDESDGTDFAALELTEVSVLTTNEEAGGLAGTGVGAKSVLIRRECRRLVVFQ